MYTISELLVLIEKNVEELEIQMEKILEDLLQQISSEQDS